MPCLIVTGHPASGKTTLSELLKQRALQHPAIDSVILLNEESVCPGKTKQECYENPGSEKQTRASLKAAFDRAPKTPRVLVILDSLNYIKGFRYELHCLSKASGEKHGILWVLNSLQQVQTWNKAYSSELLKELIQRYEPPDERNRWDKPLYTVDVSGGSGDASIEVLTESVYNMHSLEEAMAGAGGEGRRNAALQVPQQKKPKKSAFSRVKKSNSQIAVANSAASTSAAAPTIRNEGQKNQKTVEEQLNEILDSFLLKVQPLKVGTSTRQQVAGNANVLQQLDSTTQRLVSSIASAQNIHTGGKLQVKTTTGVTLMMDYKRSIALPELRRLRTQYLKWSAMNPPEDATEKGIGEAFLKYIQEQL